METCWLNDILDVIKSEIDYSKMELILIFFTKRQNREKKIGKFSSKNST